MRTLLEVARGGSLAAAAATLGYTPSAVSQQIRALEREAGCPLVERRGRTVALTPPGRVLAGHAEHVVGRLAAARAELEAITELRSGELRLGWFSTAGAVLIPRVVAAFRHEHPGVALTLVEADPGEAAELLLDAELDLALVYRFSGDPELPAAVTQRRIASESIYLVVARGHRMAGRARVTLPELEGEDFVQGVRHGPTLDTLPNACRAAGFEARVVLRTEEPNAWHGLVAAGVGVAVMPRLSLSALRDDLVAIPLDAPSLVRTISLAEAPVSYRPPALAPMARLIEAAARELSDPEPVPRRGAGAR